MTTLNNLTDVTITSPAAGQRLVYEDGAWINKAVNEPAIEEWVRNAAWPAFPAITLSDEKFIGQKAVFDHGSNFLALLAQGAYTVDWGDGTVEDFDDNVQAEHLYDFSNATLYSDPSLPYKVATVTVTPQVAASLTLITLDCNHTGSAPAHDSGWLDVAVSMPNAAAGASVIIGGAQVVRNNMIERVRALNIGGATSLASMCSRLRGLKEFEIGNTAAVTDMASMFNACYSLQTVPLFNTAAVTTMASMFGSCYGLLTVPLFNTAAVTSMASMFAGCIPLQTVPLFNTAAVTTMANMFQNCYSLQTVPLFNTAAVTTMASMFQYSTALPTVPLFNTAAVTTMANMFLGCYALQTVPLFNTASVTTMANMFQYCYALQTVPLFDTIAVTTMANMFHTCPALQQVPQFNTVAVTTMASMFQSCAALQTVPLFAMAGATPVTVATSMLNSCSSIQSIPAMDLSAVTTTTTMFATCPSISRIEATPPKVNFSITGCNLSRAALVELFTNLDTVVTQRTLTITGNWGVATLDAADRLIATSKNWALVE